ncbi:MAG: hypothetical protein QM729_02445 [Solirubrobacterales bacterium]
MRKSHLLVAGLALVGLLVIAGCGGGGSSSSSSAEAEPVSNSGYGGGRYGGNESAETTAAPETGSGAAVVKVMNTPDLGKVIVDAEGMTLYDFHKDKGTTSSCYGGCATAWPPLLTEGEPTAEGGAEASLLGTTKRKDGSVQVTYGGHPLYGFEGDSKPGETNGNDVDGFGAEWYALEPNGEEPKDD